MRHRFLPGSPNCRHDGRFHEKGAQQKPKHIFWLISFLLVGGLAGAGALADRAAADTQRTASAFEALRAAFPRLDLGSRQLAGQAAVDRIGPNLQSIARWYGVSAERLRGDLLKDHRLRVDKGGRLLFVEELGSPLHAGEVAPSQQASIQQGALVGLDQTFRLHSHAGAARTIYLDFDGAVISGTVWNKDGAAITAVPYDIDANPASFSDAEMERIQFIWQRVAEDFAPFGVDVTTEPPPADRLTRSSLSDQVFGTSVVITKTTGVYSCSCGGIAYVGVFNSTADGQPADYYKPAFVFYDMLGNGQEKAVAEAISHEVGHNMGLHHDGTATDAYFTGQGSDATTAWAPIMGAGYYKPLTQFSKGEYGGADNLEDDFIVAQNFGMPLRVDDYGNTPAIATPLSRTVSGGTVSGSMDGIIGIAGDRDVFEIVAGAGALSVSATPATRSPNLDLAVNLLDIRGNVIASANPWNTLDARLDTNLPTQGTYYLEVRGSGRGDPSADGYSPYGSAGNYRLTAAYAAPAGTPPVAVISATPSQGAAPLTAKLSGAGSKDDGKVSFWYWDFGDGTSDMTGSMASLSHVYKTAGTRIARLKVVDDSGLTSSTSQVISVGVAAPKMQVKSIQISSRSSGGYRWAVAVVSIVDQAGRAVSNARVSGSWTGLVSQATGGATGSTGTIALSSPKTRKTGCFDVTVSNVTSSSYVFNSSTKRSARICG